MDVQHLAAILRENGDKVLNSTSKLSLSTTLLKDLNKNFGMIIDEREALNSTFQVIGTSSSKIELLFDLQFLHDFVQRTVSLKLTPPYINYTETDFVDIRKFKNLKILEIRRIPIKQILGLQCLRTQLQHLICVHAVDNLKELFIDCGGDKTERYIWNELKEVVLMNNNLKTIDNSLEYVPWLQYLDLSHNKLINVQPIDCLTNLKQLNLSFNQLEAVPLFNKEISRKLQILVLKNNYIEDLTGLAYLINLITLDLSCNCLVDHQNLTTLPSLTALQWLSLEGNPLYFHPDHRRLTTSRLHPNTSTVKFILDGHLLSKSEMAVIGTYKTIPISRTQLSPTISIHRDHLSSNSSSTSVNTNLSEITAIQVSSSLTKSFTKKGKLRAAVIVERDDNGEVLNELINSVTSVESIEKDNEHLETKKQIETLRSKFGETWLQSVGGSMVQDILGMPKLSQPVASSPYEQEFKLHAAEVVKPEEQNEQNEKDPDKTDVISDLSTNNTFVTASDGSVFGDKEQTLTSDSASGTSDEEQVEDGSEESMYLVQIKYKAVNDPEEIFLLITDKYIKEKDLNGQVKCKWQLEMLTKCELISIQPPTVALEYETVRVNMKNREYIINEEEVPKLMSQLNDIISEQSSKDINQTTFNCMKCSHSFKVKTKLLKSVACNKIIPTCPKCDSTIVYEVDNSTQTKQSTPQNSLNQNNSRPDSPSECSIGSAASVQESSSSQIDDSTISENALKRYESDIEVISNPSQSSIEVLDDHSRPGRKRSSEERKTNMMPTIPDVTTVATNTLPVALTESSSSSSFTESVCTAYDNQLTLTSRPDSCLEVGIIKEEEESKETAGKEEKKSGLISSIFEGLFTSPKEGTRSTIQSNGDKNDEIKFNYSDNFSNVDHRIKLHLYQHIFEDEHEDFVWLLKCSLLCSGAIQPINACLVLSTQKVYILQIKNSINSDDLLGWLVKKDSYTINRLQTVFALPWKQGIGISIHTPGKELIYHLCILQDMQYTSNFFNYLVSNPLPGSCDLVSSISERPMMNLQQSLLSYVSKNTNEETVKPSNLCLLTIFSKCTINSNSTRELSMGVLIINSNDLVLIQDLTWLMPESKNIPVFDVIQPISNLIELEFEENTIDFHFLDEVQGYEEIWCVEFATENSMKTAISAIKTPWEQIFSVPLQVNYKVHSV